MAAPLMRRLVSLAAVPILLASLLVIAPHSALAASGGRIGGGSFRSAPSMPRSFSGSSGYRGGYGGGFGGGGIGFPFIVPIFGFGGGGLFGFLVLMAVAGLLMNALRGGGGPRLAGGDGEMEEQPPVEGPVTMAQVQVGLLASARDLQSDLRRLAAAADTSSSVGLQRVLQDTTLALLRNPELWVYANVETGEVRFAQAESTFNRLSMQERSKLRQEITTNVSGQRLNGGGPVVAGRSDAASDYLVVTLLVASRRRLQLTAAGNAEQLRDSLQRLGSVGADDLLALEVIWQPEGEGESLSSAELVTQYPDLQHL
ncbi:MAG: DUF1517 domain-containing protein [Cyanobium sp.]|jgi:uncharacterized membrane protein|nr:DUF1517 domain-containing protein [Synechococcaceae cyanobacterium]